MKAHEQHATRRAALNILAANPHVNVYVPEAVDPAEVLRSLTTAIFSECTEYERAVVMAEEIQIDLAALIRRTAEAFTDSRTHLFDASARGNAQMALGAHVIRLIWSAIEREAINQIGEM